MQANSRQVLIEKILQHYEVAEYQDVELLARQVTQNWPDDGFGWKALGTSLCLQNKTAEALPSLREAARLMPRNAETFSSLGTACKSLGRQEEAFECFRQAIALAPDYLEALISLAGLLKDMGRLEDSLLIIERAVIVNPDDPDLHNLRAGTYADIGRLDKAIESYRRALEVDPQHLCAYSNMLLISQYHPEIDPLSAREEACRFGDTARQLAQPYTTWPNTMEPNRRLRIGFVSADFGVHPVGYFLKGILVKIDAARLELFVYSNRNDAEDEVTGSIRQCVAHWRDIWGVGDAKVAQLVRDDTIDILVDLAGHTGGGRPSLFCWKPAPVQVAWLGYFATTGVKEIDYILADRRVLPESEEAHFVEKPWLLPDIYYCYSPPLFATRVAPLPANETGQVTFGCFNNLTKVSDQVIACWCRILQAMPNSRLLLKAKQLRDDNFREKLLRRFAACGIEPDRLVLEPNSPRRLYLAAFDRVDLALDPFPFPGGATTIEGLWMGVPVLTLRGNRFIAHQGETILHAAGLDDWIAQDIDEYVAKALHFAFDLNALARLRATLRLKVFRSPVFDTKRFAANLEKAFFSMWQKWIGQQSA